MSTIPAPLCEHPAEAMGRRSFRVECPTCGSYWDTESLAQVVPYDATYPEMRGHFDGGVARLKVRTLHHWLETSRVDPAGKVVCEVGFGGGSCLPFLAERARIVIGLEANGSAIERLRRDGCPAELHLVTELPARFAAEVDLWIFQDSFEHIPNPARFVDWMRGASASHAEILLVAPRADSISRRIMGRWWPHKLPDHQFQWSRRGVVELMARRGFAVRSEFFPLKFASPRMFVAHALHKAGMKNRGGKSSAGGSIAVPFNFGEMGLVFQRSTR